MALGAVQENAVQPHERTVIKQIRANSYYYLEYIGEKRLQQSVCAQLVRSADFPVCGFTELSSSVSASYL